MGGNSLCEQNDYISCKHSHRQSIRACFETDRPRRHCVRFSGDLRRNRRLRRNPCPSREISRSDEWFAANRDCGAIVVQVWRDPDKRRVVQPTALRHNSCPSRRNFENNKVRSELRPGAQLLSIPAVIIASNDSCPQRTASEAQRLEFISPLPGLCPAAHIERHPQAGHRRRTRF